MIENYSSGWRFLLFLRLKRTNVCK